MDVKLLLLLTLFVSYPVLADNAEQLAEISELEARIEIMAKENGPFSAALFTPLMQLAQYQLDFGDTEEGIESLRRAQNIAHRNEGVHTPTQLQIVEKLTELALGDEEFEEANKHKRFSYFINRHTFENDEPGLLNAHAEIARWYIFTGQPRRARKITQEALTLAEESGQDLLPIAILENRARLMEGICCNPRHLNKVLAKAENEALPDSLSAIYMEIADTLILGGRSERAAEYLARANAITPLSSPPRPLTFRRNLEPLNTQFKEVFKPRQDPLSTNSRLERLTRDEWLEEPEVKPQWFVFDPNEEHLGFSTRDVHETYDRETRTYAMVGHPVVFKETQLDQILPPRLQRNKEELSIEVRFTVTETGDLENIEVIESNAPIKVDRLLKRALRRTYYRPALEDGTPVASENVSFIQTFRPRRKLNEG